MNKIVAVSKDETGAIDRYQLDDGRILNREQAVDETSNGKISGVSIFTTRDGGLAIRSDRGQDDYSLDSLPEIK